MVKHWLATYPRFLISSHIVSRRQTWSLRTRASNETEFRNQTLKSASICGSPVASPNRTGAGDFALNMWITDIFDFARAGDGHFQVIAHRHARVARAGDGNLGSFRLQRFSTKIARAGYVRD